MEKSICATLDLSKSLSNFSSEVTKCLELTNITEWNGKILEEREGKIREIALILAGQCIAILLYNLSQSESANQTAINKTKGWWDGNMQKHGYRKREILTVGNVLVTLKLPYMVRKKSTATTKNKISTQGLYPLLKWLGMSSGLTPLVWSTVAQYGAITSSFEAACTTLTGWGINLSYEEVESKEWFVKVRKSLKKGKAKSLISQMDELIAVATGERCKIMVVKRNYILDAYRKGRLNYDKAIDKKLPIGSGAIESLIRQVVNLRIKGNSKFWLKENAEIMLHLRCQWIAKSWDNFCASIFNSFIKPQHA